MASAGKADPLRPALQTLRRKAEERNPDEFYFAMHRAQTKRGIHELPCALCNSS